MRIRNVKDKDSILLNSKYVLDSFSFKGKWREVFENDNPICVEIGTGKCTFIYEMARNNPNVNYIGIERIDTVLALGVKEIEKLRTAVLGYDREEVVLYIRELVEYYGQKNEEAVRELYLEKMQLAAENAGLRAQIPTQEKLYAEAEGKAEEILGGAKETAETIMTAPAI